MAYSTSQLEIPSTKGTKAFCKKSRKKKIRQMSKNINFVPINGKYKGYA